MSILIKREMPKGCWACPFAIGKHYECLFTNKSYNWGLTKRPSDCPLVEIPTPHGRLGDLDALIKDLAVYRGGHNEGYGFDGGMHEAYNNSIELVEEAPTVIEAEGSEA